MSVWMRILPILIVILFGLYFNILLADRKRLLDAQIKAQSSDPKSLRDIFSDMEKMFTTVIETCLFLKSYDALMMRGRIKIKMDRPAEAAGDFKRLIEEHPNSQYTENASEYLQNL